ncbi:type II toxin-antitoxin system VapC family toxin [Candidatus Regiella insecticola]|uniref:PIN domain nuclease n=1 Tax=Candidatus Regiella insecticola TaxID=138073 RepID=A0A6L2ZKH8_9ENTR|nr:type II toxin-antitoxin system VapC family toxin [Candidatus Regiella insecticola]GFN45333.1 PIN domain nuclease [Candidatus Regiella insecticola]
MRLLLDTHVYLWWLQDHPKLSENGREKIIAASEVYISSASIWEASIKIGIGKLDVDINELIAEIAGSGFQELPITTKHAAMVMRLPNIHRDPFDRILIAQAMCEPLRFLTADEILIKYSELAELV